MKQSTRSITALITFLLAFLPVALAAGPSQGALDATTASGLESYLDVTKIVPDLTQFHQWFEALIIGLNLPGFVMTISLYIAGFSLISAIVLALVRFATGKEWRFFGMSGSFSQMILSVFALGVLATPLPFTTGGLSYALWHTSFKGVTSKVDPIMMPLVKEKTAELGQAVFDFTMTSMAVAVSPIQAIANTWTGKASVDNPAQLSGQMSDYVSSKQGLLGMNSMSTIWSLGMLLIAGTYLSYQIAIAFTMFVAIFLGLFFPIAVASIGFNDRLVVLFISSMVKNSLMVLVLPFLMVFNILITFGGPISMLTKMMQNNAQVAGAMAANFSEGVQKCAQNVTGGNIFTDLLSKTPGAGAVVNMLADKGCGASVGFQTYLATLPKSILFIFIGLAFAAIVFTGMSGFAQAAYKAVNKIVDMAFDGVGEAMGKTRTGAGAMAGRIGNGTVKTGNRIGGAVMMGVAAGTGNIALANAGRQAMMSGANPVTSGIGAYASNRASANSSKAGSVGKASGPNDPGRSAGNDSSVNEPSRTNDSGRKGRNDAQVGKPTVTQEPKNRPALPERTD